MDEIKLPIYTGGVWVKFIPIKVNVFSWRARRDRLPTRVNLSRRGVLLDSHLCPLCTAAMEDVQHVFFRCDVARVVLRKICRWWDLDWQEICSFSDWDAWFLSFRLSSRLKSILEDMCKKSMMRLTLKKNKADNLDQLVGVATPVVDVNNPSVGMPKGRRKLHIKGGKEKSIEKRFEKHECMFIMWKF
ncbi:RNA-directed DNA polymerase, eukaryota [Tanacetum coccineum]